MATLTAQKVRGLLKKANLPLDVRSSRYSSGYAVRDFLWDLIQVTYVDGSHSSSGLASWTETRVAKIAEAAQALILAGLSVYMSAKVLGPYERGIDGVHCLYLESEGAALNPSRFVQFDGEVYASFFAERIAEEKANYAAEQEKKENERIAKEDAEMRARFLAIQLNPAIKWDLSYPNGVKVTSVKLFDQRLAVLTVAVREVEDIDWDDRTDGGCRTFKTVEAEINAVYPGKYNPGTWERRSATYKAGRDETVYDLIWNWVAQYGDY